MTLDLVYLLDCSTPTADTGYVVGSSLSTTYESISSMTCDTGYEGTAANITCTSEGTWSSQTGCTIVGKLFRARRELMLIQALFPTLALCLVRC